MKNLLLIYLKNLFSDFHNAIIAIILVSLIAGGGSIYLFFESQWILLRNTILSPTPLWVTIALLLALYIWFSAKTKKTLSYDLSSLKDYVFIEEKGLLWKVSRATHKLNPTPLCLKHQHEMLELKDSYLCSSYPSASRKTVSKEAVNIIRQLVLSKVDAALDGHLKK
ncbi:MAG: hypothetical protein HOI47_32990 [Candidatus Scalindua sp.]|jgi:hypothetical protein|nr:hypothetical protein [Candidatus Scalindua sp.]MBT6053203.1 hypothetical protein [Candidatus Scalindua sp.]MBT6231484.1 hypothetical protein [Candidatus Scalindua sp.]